MLFVDNDDVKFFSRHIANLNVHYFAEEGRTVSVPKMTDPLSSSRRDIPEKLLEVGPIIVYKVGVMTDLTMGRFVKYWTNHPRGGISRRRTRRKWRRKTTMTTTMSTRRKRTSC